MENILTRLFGSYTPNYSTVTETFVNEAGETIERTSHLIADGFAGVDIQWVAGVVLFGICLYSMFRLMGLALGGKR